MFQNVCASDDFLDKNPKNTTKANVDRQDYIKFGCFSTTNGRVQRHLTELGKVLF